MTKTKIKSRNLAVIALALTVIFLLSSCDILKFGEPDVPDVGSVEYTELNVGDVAPNFSVELLDGSIVNLSDFKGKAVFLNFWASWCGPCIGEMPDIQELSEAFPDDLVVLAVNLGEEKDIADSFIQQNGYTFNIGLDEQGQILEKYPTDGIPYTVIVDTNGIISSIHLGADSDMFSVYKEDVETALSR
jgi:thiol-disulfide isomerase/thioredoxin